MAKTTIYLPDELAEELKKYPDLNISGAAQRCIRAAIDLERNRQGTELESLSVTVWEDGESMIYEFQGRKLGRDDRHATYEFVSSTTGQREYMLVDSDRERVEFWTDADTFVSDLVTYQTFGRDWIAQSTASALGMTPRRSL